ncbi:MAG: histidine phosphatase family protein [Deltaproteobacteria bacterium]|nr:MAG: histidine phosphatase family protein [Deltaproteobacteria bacterium]
MVDSGQKSGLEVVLVRHGITTWNQDKRLQGQLDVPLAPEGVDQARRLAAHLAAQGERFDHVVASDLARARETADIVAGALGDAPVAIDARWRERDLGELQGRRWDEIGGTSHDIIATIEAPPGGETREAQEERVAQALDGLRVSHAGGRVLVVTHGGCVKAALALADVGARIVPNASLTVLREIPGGWEAGSIGDTAHLA